MTREHSYDRLLERVDEIVDFTPHFPNTSIVLPHGQFRMEFSHTIRKAFDRAGFNVMCANSTFIGGMQFGVYLSAISSSALRGRSMDTLYVPLRDDLSSRQYRDYDYMMESIFPVVKSSRCGKIYVY